MGRSVQIPSRVAIFKARLRLGAEPMRRLYEAVARPLAVPG
ncbi:transposase domain-containing protein, partial [Ferrimicrobium sp.]